MGSKIEPYFILTAEKVTDPRELKNIIRHEDNETPDKLPTTPPPSGVSGQTGTDIHLKIGRTFSKKRKGFVKYKIPIKEIRRKETLNKKMEIIKEKLEKSRERFKGQKRNNEEINLMCGPSHLNKDHNATAETFKLERSVSDVTHNKHNEGSSPYTYFVVSEEDIKEDPIGKIVSKSADKRRRVRNAEENRWKRERTDGQKSPGKKAGLARELGIKSCIKLKSDSSGSNKPSVSHIVFEGPENQEQPKFQHTSSKVMRSAHSPPRIPPCTPATSLLMNSGENKLEQPIEDTDDNVPRKPFLSGPLYSGKNRGTHSFSLQHLELPNISADQKRRALGLGTKFEDFAYPKPQSEQRQRNVSFANPLPVVKGTGMLFNLNEMKDIGLEIPPLGPRSVTLGSIVLPSEKLDKQSMCQKYIAGDSLATSRKVKKAGVPMSLPKIDIVSNVYDDMIIKMIKEYLQDTETPSRQSQLAKELLVHLQKHNEHMKELNVPNLNKKHKQKITRDDIFRSHSKTQQLINEMSFIAPPNSAEDPEAKVMTPLAKTRDLMNSGIFEESDESGVDRQLLKSAENPRSIPFVQITFKERGQGSDATGFPLAKEDSTLSNSKDQTKEKKSNERPILSAVTPVSFQMAPPGLSKEDSFVSTSYKSQLLAKT